MNDLQAILERLEKLYPKYIDLSLKRIKKLLAKLDNPHKKLPPCIHIAGTNGKGSILSFTKKIMNESNYKTHAYISPHLERINERFIISNKIISNKLLLKNLKFIEKINDNEPITFYEITTALAFYLFQKYPADFVLLETGLGGKLDATNIINKSLISIISPISLDHQEFLGKSLVKITKEKLGIIKNKSTVISSKQKKIVFKEIKKFTNKKGNKLISFNYDWKINSQNKEGFLFTYQKKLFKYPYPSLVGKHQIENLSTALATIHYLEDKGYFFSKKGIKNGIIKTKWPGRLEIIKKEKPTIYLDGAHNIDGAKIIRNFLKESNSKAWIILGMLNSKKNLSYLKILKNSIEGVIAIEIPNEKNSILTSQIKLNCKKINVFCKEEKDVFSSLDYLNKKNNVNKIIITGSLYLVGNIRKKILSYC